MPRKSGTPTIAGLNIVGLSDFRKDLKDVGSEWPKQLTVANRKVAQAVAPWAQAEATALGGVHAHAAKYIKGYATASQAKIGVASGPRTPAGVAVWGAKRHTGWYRKRRYANSAPQHPPWIGQVWDVGDANRGPYGINAAIHRHMNQIAEIYMAELDELADRAFNND